MKFAFFTRNYRAIIDAGDVPPKRNNTIDHRGKDRPEFPLVKKLYPIVRPKCKTRTEAMRKVIDMVEEETGSRVPLSTVRAWRYKGWIG